MSINGKCFELHITSENALYKFKFTTLLLIHMQLIQNPCALTQSLTLLKGLFHSLTGGAIALAYTTAVLHGIGVDLEITADILQSGNTQFNQAAIDSIAPFNKQASIHLILLC